MTASRASRLWVVGGALLALLLVGVTYVLVISPARSEVASVQSQVDDATLQQTVLRHRLRDLAATAKAMEGLHGQVAAAKAALPPTVDTQGLLRRVQAVATATGTHVDDVTISPAVASSVDGVSAVPVSISLSGPADGLVAAVDTLQGDRSRLLTVGTFTLKAGDEGAVFEVALTAQVYAAGPPSTAVDGGPGVAGAAAAAGAAGPAGAAAGATPGGTPAAS